MKKIAAVALALSLALPAAAKTVAGVKFSDTIDVNGTALQLHGAGIRKKFFFKVYAAGFYAAQPTADANAAVSSDEVKRVRMVFLRNVTGKQVMDAFREGFEANSAGPGLAALLEKLGPVAAATPDMKEGSEIVVTYVPGQGTTFDATGGHPVTVAGREFAEAIFRNWFGAKPADADLKKAFLGK